MWDSWEKYKKNFAKSYLKDNLDKIVEAEKHMAFSDNKYQLAEYSKIATLIENTYFKNLMEKSLGKKHIINKVLQEFAVMCNEKVEINGGSK